MSKVRGHEARGGREVLALRADEADAAHATRDRRAARRPRGLRGGRSKRDHDLGWFADTFALNLYTCIFRTHAECCEHTEYITLGSRIFL